MLIIATLHKYIKYIYLTKIAFVNGFDFHIHKYN